MYLCADISENMLWTHWQKCSCCWDASWFMYDVLSIKSNWERDAQAHTYNTQIIHTFYVFHSTIIMDGCCRSIKTHKTPTNHGKFAFVRSCSMEFDYRLNLRVLMSLYAANSIHDAGATYECICIFDVWRKREIERLRNDTSLFPCTSMSWINGNLFVMASFRIQCITDSTTSKNEKKKSNNIFVHFDNCLWHCKWYR